MYIWVVLSSILAYGICVALIPIIIRKAHQNNWLDVPTGRKKHSIPIPPLGGVGIFIGFWTAMMFYAILYGFPLELGILLVLTLALAIMGVKDDLQDMSALIKLAAQLGIGILLYLFDICQLEGFYGFWGITEVPESINFITTIFTVALIVNAYNLIDGINGLAGSLGFMSALLFGVFFYNFGVYFWAFIAFNLAGAIMGFLRFNFGRASVFMGDNGSTFIGLILAILFFQLLQLPASDNNLLPVALSIIAVPVVDLLRVFSLRISKGKSPYVGDRSHIHYIMIKKLVLPERVCYLLIAFNLILIALIWNFAEVLPVTEGIIITLGSVWLLAVFGNTENFSLFTPKTSKKQINEI